MEETYYEKKCIGDFTGRRHRRCLITGCGAASSGTARSSAPQQTQESAPEDGDAGKSAADTPDLTGHTLMIYCGAGMTKPFQEIADSFKAATSCEMNVTYANAGQIQSQITTSEEGDMFIAGSAEELKPVESYVSESKALVKHIPVLAVQSGNPKNITSLAGLAEEGVSLIIGDIDSTPIGKIAKKALTDAGIFDKVQIEASTATVPRWLPPLPRERLTQPLSGKKTAMLRAWKS